MTEWNVWRVLVAYRKWVGWIIVFGVLVLSIQQGWIDEPFIQRMTDRAISVIQALMPNM